MKTAYMLRVRGTDLYLRKCSVKGSWPRTHEWRGVEFDRAEVFNKKIQAVSIGDPKEHELVAVEVRPCKESS